MPGGFNEKPLRDLMEVMSNRRLSLSEVKLFHEERRKAGEEYRLAYALSLRGEFKAGKLEDPEEKEAILASFKPWREYYSEMSHLCSAVGNAWYYYTKRLREDL